MRSDDMDYLQRRCEQEEDLAANAATEAARHIHAELAELYRARLNQPDENEPLAA